MAALRKLFPSKDKEIFLKGLKILTLIGCILGFTYNSYETLEKYFNHATLVLASSKTQKQLPAPDVILCYVNAFTEAPNRKTFLIEENYINVTRNPFDILRDKKIRQSNLGDTLGDAYNKLINYTAKELNTAYSGRCLVLKFKDLVSINFSANIHVK